VVPDIRLNIVKAYYVGSKAVVALIITAELFGELFFPAVSRLGFRGIGRQRLTHFLQVCAVAA